MRSLSKCVSPFFAFMRAVSKLKRRMAALEKGVDEIMNTLADIKNEVTVQTTTIASLRALISGLQAQVKAAPSLTPEAQTEIDAIFASAHANSVELADALAANITAPPAAA